VEHLPERYSAWQIEEEVSLFLNVSIERARYYLKWIEKLGYVEREGWVFVKTEKSKKPKQVRASDIGKFKPEI
jgi:hypothetical protein